MMDLSFALIILVSRVFVYTLALPSATTNCDMRDFTKKYATPLTQPAAPICRRVRNCEEVSQSEVPLTDESVRFAPH